MQKALHLVHLLNVIWLRGLLIAVPVAVSALFLRRLRPWFGNYIYLLSYLIGFATWLAAAVTILNNWGVVWMLVGFFVGGVGIIPMALIDAIFHKEWMVTFQFLLQLFVLFGLRAGGMFFTSAPEHEATFARASQPEQKKDCTVQDGTIADAERIGTFEELLKLDPSTMASIRVLPQEVCD